MMGQIVCCNRNAKIHQEEETDVDIGKCQPEHPRHHESSRLFVQFMEDNPFALANFGATLWSSPKHGHVLKFEDWTGLAQSAKLRNGDVIVGLNGADVDEAAHQALVDSIRDVGNKIAITFRRRREGELVYGRVAFVLGKNKEGRPVMQHHDQIWCGTNRHLIGSTTEVNSRFPMIQNYRYYESAPIKLSVVNEDLYLAFQRGRASFGSNQRELVMCRYQSVNSGNDDVSIALASQSGNGRNDSDESDDESRDHSDNDSDDDSNGDTVNRNWRQMCISGKTEQTLDVVRFHPYMMDNRRPIPYNSMFFLLSRQPNQNSYVTSAHRGTNLYLTYDGNKQASLSATDRKPLDVVH